MAKILSYYNLCSISDKNGFLGVSEDADADSIVNTLGRNILISIQLTNQQQMNSWTVLEKFTNKVVYNFKTKKYVGVFGGRYIRCWDSSIKDINKLKKIKLQKFIEDLISIENKDIIIVYKDGTCASLEQSIQNRKLVNPNSNKPIINSKNVKVSKIACFTIGENTLMTYFTKNLNTNAVELIYYKVDEQLCTMMDTVNKLKITRTEQNVSLVGYTVVDGNMSPSLLTIWSDSRIFMLPLRDDMMGTTERPGYFLSMLNTLKVDQPLSILGISKECVAIYGANKNQEGGSLILYNSQFTITQSKQHFKVYFNDTRLWLVRNYILLEFGECLVCVSFKISLEKLSNLIGTQQLDNFTNKVDKDCMNEENEYEEIIEFDVDTQRKYNSSSASELNHFKETPKKKWKNRNKTITAFESVERFQNDTKKLNNHNIPLELIRSPELLFDKIYTNISNNFPHSLLSIEEITLLVQELQTCGASEYELTETLFPILIKAKLSNDLITCLRTYSNVSDKMLVQILKYFVKLNSNKESKPQANGICELKDQTINLNPSNGLDTVLSCAFQKDHINVYLRNELDFNDIIFVLNQIHDTIECQEKPLLQTRQFEDEMEIFNWFSAILDAFMQQFVLSSNKDLLKLISKWKGIVDSHINDIRELTHFSSVLYSLVKGKKFNSENYTSKWYSIEAVKLY